MTSTAATFSILIPPAGTATPKPLQHVRQRLRGEDRLPPVAGLVQTDDQAIADERRATTGPGARDVLEPRGACGVLSVCARRGAAAHERERETDSSRPLPETPLDGS